MYKIKSIMNTVLLTIATFNSLSPQNAIADQVLSDEPAELLYSYFQRHHYETEKTSVGNTYVARSMQCTKSTTDNGLYLYTCTIVGSIQDKSEGDKSQIIIKNAELFFLTIAQASYSRVDTTVIIKDIACTEEVESDESESLEHICTYDN